jgi:hypothetical protein
MSVDREGQSKGWERKERRLGFRAHVDAVAGASRRNGRTHTSKGGMFMLCGRREDPPTLEAAYGSRVYELPARLIIRGLVSKIVQQRRGGGRRERKRAAVVVEPLGNVFAARLAGRNGRHELEHARARINHLSLSSYEGLRGRETEQENSNKRAWDSKATRNLVRKEARRSKTRPFRHSAGSARVHVRETAAFMFARQPSPPSPA